MKGARGCLLELTWRGAEPITLPSGGERRFLEDGDEVVLRGACRRPAAAAIGFGECAASSCRQSRHGDDRFTGGHEEGIMRVAFRSHWRCSRGQ